jgi:hypothetical protein
MKRKDRDELKAKVERLIAGEAIGPLARGTVERPA